MSKVLEEQEPAAPAAGRSLHDDLGPRRSSPSTARRTRAGVDYARDLGDPGQFPYTRGIHETMYRGKLWTMRQFAGFGSAAQTNARFKYLLEHGGARAVGRLRPADADGPRPGPPAVARRGGQVRRRGHVARRHGDALRGHPARRGHDLDDDQLAGGDAARLLHPGGGEAGRRAGEAGRHAAGRHPEGVHRPEGVHLPAAAQHADRRGHDPLLHRAHAEVEHDLDLGLPHPRGGLDGGAGAGLHAARRDRVRAVVRGRRDGRGQLRAAAVLLLQLAQRLLRGDREVPRGAADLGAHDEGALRGEEPALVDAAASTPRRRA